MPLRFARALILLGALGIVVSLFLPWYQQGLVCAQSLLACPTRFVSAWSSFRFADVLLVLVAVGLACGVGVSLLLEEWWVFAGIALLGWFAAAGTVFAIFNPSLGYVAQSTGGGFGRPFVGFFCELASTGLVVVGGLAARLDPPSHV